MGLSVSQIRLLALTNRKADIELQVQLDSKRKQMLTRQSTELAQQYYNRLQNSTIQYSTTNGYEDVNYNYLMGETKDASYTSDFLQAVATGDYDYTSRKAENNMILVNQYGEVVANDTIAQVVTETYNTFRSQSIQDQVAQAVMGLVVVGYNSSSGASGSAAITTLFNKIFDGSRIDTGLKQKYAEYVKAFIANGGFKDAGNLYEGTYSGSTKYFRSAQEAKDYEAGHGTDASVVTPVDGYAYAIYNSSGNIKQATQLYYKSQGGWTGVDKDTAVLLGNLTSYFAPILGAALQNGMTAKVEATPTATWGKYDYNGSGYTQDNTVNNAGSTWSGGNVLYPTDSVSTMVAKVRAGLTTSPACIQIQDTSGRYHYFKSTSPGNVDYVDPASLGGTFFGYTYDTSGRGNFDAAKNTETLQAGLKSGVFQLCMVDDVTRGAYKKNTTLSYFVNKSYVVDRTDSSKKEEITAWFNSEQAKISEKETYWDTEIQNLSTELNSVNTEIESVKTMKSNAIKSVFDWGGS